jgi:uncharacterized protein (DUF2252 family)
VASVVRHDVGRDPRRVRLKYEAMAADPFAFFRATDHLFYDRLAITGALRSAPRVWICGDLHFENFGSFEGENGLTYFDVNDFDEACLAPCTWDVARFLASLLVCGAPASLAKRFVDEYAKALANGHAGWIERETAKGPVRALLDAVRDPERKAVLDKRAPLGPRGRRLKVDEVPTANSKAIPISPKRRRGVERALAKHARTTEHPERFEVLDVADGVSGTGALGLDHYVVLTRGKGSPDKNWLLSMKAAVPSAPASRARGRQPSVRDEAERVVACQLRLQAASPRHLAALSIDGAGYVLSEFHPSEDGIELRECARRPKDLKRAVVDMARLTAWAHLRASGRRGAESADALEAFGRETRWRVEATRQARAAAATARGDWRAFRQAWDRDKVSLPVPWK